MSLLARNVTWKYIFPVLQGSIRIQSVPVLKRSLPHFVGGQLSAPASSVAWTSLEDFLATLTVSSGRDVLAHCHFSQNQSQSQTYLLDIILILHFKQAI